MAEIINYYTVNGNSEVEKKLLKMNEDAKKGDLKATAELDSIFYALEKFENGMPHSRQLEGPLYEIRAKRNRITYFRWRGYIVLLTFFKKSSNEAPVKEIRRARRRMKDWTKRKGS